MMAITTSSSTRVNPRCRPAWRVATPRLSRCFDRRPSFSVMPLSFSPISISIRPPAVSAGQAAVAARLRLHPLACVTLPPLEISFAEKAKKQGTIPVAPPRFAPRASADRRVAGREVDSLYGIRPGIAGRACRWVAARWAAGRSLNGRLARRRPIRVRSSGRRTDGRTP
jgi:hypothetical protein